MELWDAYDEHFKYIKDVVLVRGEKIPEGMFHLVCEVIVKHYDGTYLLMQRDARKHLGLMWEATAGGSALKKESAIECAKRELFEETGIQANSLNEIGRVVQKENQSLFVEYLCMTNCDKKSIVLQEGETVAYKWVSSKELCKMSSNELASTRIMQFVEELNR